MTLLHSLEIRKDGRCKLNDICLWILLLLLLLLLKHIWGPLITKWFFSLQLKSKNENA